MTYSKSPISPWSQKVAHTFTPKPPPKPARMYFTRDRRNMSSEAQSTYFIYWLQFLYGVKQVRCFSFSICPNLCRSVPSHPHHGYPNCPHSPFICTQRSWNSFIGFLVIDSRLFEVGRCLTISIRHPLTHMLIESRDISGVLLQKMLLRVWYFSICGPFSQVLGSKTLKMTLVILTWGT